jgi:hypothetical protein
MFRYFTYFVSGNCKKTKMCLLFLWTALNIAVKGHFRECRKMCLHAKDFPCEEVVGISPIGLKSLILDGRGLHVHTWCIPESNYDATIVQNIAMLDRVISDDG